jgi:hypothetical protein
MFAISVLFAREASTWCSSPIRRTKAAKHSISSQNYRPSSSSNKHAAGSVGLPNEPPLSITYLCNAVFGPRMLSRITALL